MCHAPPTILGGVEYWRRDAKNRDRAILKARMVCKRKRVLYKGSYSLLPTPLNIILQTGAQISALLYCRDPVQGSIAPPYFSLRIGGRAIGYPVIRRAGKSFGEA